MNIGRNNKVKLVTATITAMLFASGCSGSRVRGETGGTGAPVDGGSDGERRDAGDGAAGQGGGGNGGGGGGDAVALAAPKGCARELTSGDDHTCILYDNGDVWCLGANDTGQLGNGSTVASGGLTKASLTNVAHVAAGGAHTCAVDQSGHLFCWGSNRAAELGSSTPGAAPARTPIAVADPSAGAIALAAGGTQTCLLDKLLHVTCWGTDAAGTVFSSPRHLAQVLRPVFRLELGQKNTRIIDDAKQLFDLSNWQRPEVAVADLNGGDVWENTLAAQRDCVLKASGTVWCRGQGVGIVGYAVVTELGTDVVQIRSGEGFTCARTRTGQVICQGRDDLGQLGDDASGTSPASAAVTLAGLNNVADLSAGRAHACVRRQDGSVWCWGTVAGRGGVIGRTMVSQAEDPSRCAALPEAPTPVENATDQLADAATAWAETQCSCGFTDSPAQVASCITAETIVLHGCLPALAYRTESGLSCMTGNAWDGALCYGPCRGGHLTLCPPPPSGPCEDQALKAGPAAFCARRNLPCDANSRLFAEAIQVCDGKADCPNGFDEVNCTRHQPAFKCAGAGSTALEFVCDRKRDCADNSDEWACPP